jgi:Zn-finger nucleic acid-binding protein
VTQRSCPHCRIKMVHRSAKGVEVDVCERCNGLWLDKGEFDALVAQRYHGRDLEADLELTANFPELCRFCRLDQSGWEQCQNCGLDLGLHCPVDGTPMYIVTFGKIELDRCGECHGIFVDGFERPELSRQELTGAMVPVEDMFPDVEPGRRDRATPSYEDQTIAPSKLLAPHELNRDFPCAGCGEHKTRYSLAEREGALWCQRCVYLGVAPSVAASAAVSPAPSAANRKVGTHFPCVGCATVLSRHLLWEFDGQMWCTECGEKDERTRHRMEVARNFSAATMAFERERAAQREYLENLQSGVMRRKPGLYDEVIDLEALFTTLRKWTRKR